MKKKTMHDALAITGAIKCTPQEVLCKELVHFTKKAM